MCSMCADECARIVFVFLFFLCLMFAGLLFVTAVEVQEQV